MSRPLLLASQRLMLQQAVRAGNHPALGSALWQQQQAHSSTESGGPLDDASISSIQASFNTSPTEARAAADQLAASLSPGQRALLAASLTSHTGHDRETDDSYVQELFEAADLDGERGRLTRTEFKNALQIHRALDGSNVRVPPDWWALKMVFIASALPFVGFGFLDNFIMLVAGEEIDEAFGARLGLSTLASAGLGNLVADVIGVGAANGIERGVKKLPGIRDFKLSKHQAVMPSTRNTKAIGALVGVTIGCVLGLAPLFWNGTFFVEGR